MSKKIPPSLAEFAVAKLSGEYHDDCNLLIAAIAQRDGTIEQHAELIRLQATELAALKQQSAGVVLRYLLVRMKADERDERHSNMAETRYWCDQYKQIARAALLAQQEVQL